MWDVFLLLGDDTTDAPATGSQTTPAREDAVSSAASPAAAAASLPFGGLDILHATSAALIQALREVLLDSDFENAMKALTSWIAIKDEDLLMKVTKAEWKTRQQGKKTT